MALLETRFDSAVLDLSLGMNIILPEHPDAWQEQPAVLYLLHGLSDDHTIWCRRTSIERYAADYNLMVVMPDAYKSFYCNMVHGSNYLDFFADELPMLINRWFKVASERNKTFVAGLSMGGYGAFKLALTCPARFHSAASISGALDIASHINDEFPPERLQAFDAVFGDITSVPGSDNDLIHQLEQIEKVPDTEFFISCGLDDYLYQDSVHFRDKAGEAGLNLTYDESPGEHDWAYCDTAIRDVLNWLPTEKLEDKE
jgi:S-formylglutathione hydrolase FrmB